MSRWFQYKPFKSAVIHSNIFRTISLRNTLLLLLSLILNSSCYAQDKASGNFTVLTNNHTSLSITHFSGNTLSLRYNTLPGNQSGQNYNSFWFWRSSEVPWNTAPERMVMLPQNATQSGSYVLDSISVNILTSYIACYSLDSTAKQICACSTLDGMTDSITNSWVDISLLNVSANAIVFKYETLPGYLPQAYGNWFGIWKGSASPYNYYPPLAQGVPLDNSSASTATLNNLSLEANQMYTLIYFLGSNPTTAAVIVTFLVQ